MDRLKEELTVSGTAGREELNQLVDYTLKVQRSVILNLSPKLNEKGISFPEFFLLIYLASEEYLIMSDIAKKMGHTTAGATGIVDKLEKMGYVDRLHSAQDRRKITVRITAKGVEFVAERRKEIKKELLEMLK